jgi:hypothetical protein
MLSMAYRSWLKDVKSIHDLGDHCYVYDEDAPNCEEREAKYDEKWLARLKMDLPVAPEHRAFYGSKMHDSWVQSIERTKHELRLTLNCINADVFAAGLAHILEVKSPAVVWPVDLILRDPVYVNAVRHTPEGKLRWADWESLKGGNGPCDGPEFLSDWFHEQECRLQWIAEIWDYRDGLGRVSPSLYLMVDCAEALAEDRRAAALAKTFGDGVLPLWTDAVSGVDQDSEPRGIWAVDTMYEYLQRRMTAHQLTAAYFRGPTASP